MTIKICNTLAERIIINISEWNNYMARIVKSTDCTLSGAIKVIRELEKEGIIKKELLYNNRRKTLITLTKKGKEIRDLLVKLSRYK